MAPRPAILLVAVALAMLAGLSAGWAFLAPRRAAAAGAPVHTIGSHLGHVPQALTPRSPTDERKELRHTTQPATLVAGATAMGWRPVATAVAANPAGPRALTGPFQFTRGPPSGTSV